MAWYLNSFRWWPRFEFHKIFLLLLMRLFIRRSDCYISYCNISLLHNPVFLTQINAPTKWTVLRFMSTWYMCSSFNTLYQCQISNQFGYACANSINLYEVCNSNYLSPPMKKITKVWQIIDYCELNEIFCVVCGGNCGIACTKYKTNNTKYNYNTNIHLFIYLYMTSCSL